MPGPLQATTAPGLGANFSHRKKVGPPTSSKMFEKQVSSSGDMNQDPESDDEAEPEGVMTPISDVEEDLKDELSQAE